MRELLDTNTLRQIRFEELKIRDSGNNGIVQSHRACDNFIECASILIQVELALGYEEPRVDVAGEVGVAGELRVDGEARAHDDDGHIDVST